MECSDFNISYLPLFRNGKALWDHLSPRYRAIPDLKLGENLLLGVVIPDDGLCIGGVPSKHTKTAPFNDDPINTISIINTLESR